VLGTAAVVFLVGGPPASAHEATLDEWQAKYGPGTAWNSSSGDIAECQLCHRDADGGNPWNGYGWDLREARFAQECDTDGRLPNSDEERFACVEGWDSDGECSWNDVEILASTQPGWTEGPNNLIFYKGGDFDTDQTPPLNVAPYDPEGTGGAGGDCGTGGTGGVGGMGGMGGMDMSPPGQYKRTTIVVRPGQSIQEAVDRAKEGARIYVLAGVYKARANATNAVNITKNGIRLIGQNRGNQDKDKDKDKARGVTIKNNGQRNGIAVVPPMVTECMSCHSSMELPFPLLPGIEPGLPDPEPLVYDIEVRNIEIERFRNGLFTERVDGFVFDNVTSTSNFGYGIFPTLSYNGVIRNSRATGSSDSGIWIETSENVVAINNHVEYNVNGFEVSNSDNILLANNEMNNNTVGAAILLLPDIFDDRPGATRIDVVNNWIHDNNEPNTAPGGILSEIPPGIGILYLGVDDSLIEGNLIEDNTYVGIAIADYCAVTSQTSYPCLPENDDTSNPDFLADQTADNNRVEGNILINNGTTPPPNPPYPDELGAFTAQLSLLTVPAPLVLPIPPFPPIPWEDEDPAFMPYHGNCYENNQISSPPWVLEFFSLYDATLFEYFGGPPPPWDLPTCPAP
jgi:parallel beta-helix repeat protein